jgi:hypothetical protein
MRQVLGLMCFLMIMLSVSCSDRSCEPCPGGFIYPLEIGNRWEYACIDSMFNFRYDGPSLLDDVFRDTSVVAVTGVATLPGGIDTHVLHETKRTRWGVREADEYYRNEPDGLYRRAYRGFTDVVPIRPSGRSIRFRGREFRNVAEIIRYLEEGSSRAWGPEDSLRIYDPPVKTLEYPLEIGAQWVPNPQSPWPIERAVVGEESIAVPAGTYDCLVVQLFLDLDEDGEWDTDFEYLDFICEQGLIRRHVFIKDLVVSGGHDDTIAVYDLIMEDNLTAIRLE